jgi:hypothetical protein
MEPSSSSSESPGGGGIHGNRVLVPGESRKLSSIHLPMSLFLGSVAQERGVSSVYARRRKDSRTTRRERSGGKESLGGRAAGSLKCNGGIYGEDRPLGSNSVPSLLPSVLVPRRSKEKIIDEAEEPIPAQLRRTLASESASTTHLHIPPSPITSPRKASAVSAAILQCALQRYTFTENVHCKLKLAN